MPEPSIVFLMYHELEVPGRSLRHATRGYTRYAVRTQEFHQQLQRLKDLGYRGLSVGDALTFPDGNNVAITLDDGNETDLLCAAPLLRKLEFNATFYITVEWLGKPGHLSASQLQEIARSGFEIGCHSMTHASLDDLDNRGLQREIAEAKLQLEQILGKAVEHFSCPGGRYNQRAAETARAVGYRSVATSRIEANTSATDRYALGRVAILRGLPISEFDAICNGEGLAQMRAQSGIRDVARQVLGSLLYDGLRNLVLGDGK